MATRKKAQSVPEGFQSANIPVQFWKPESIGETLRGWYQGMRVLPAKGQYKEQVVFDVAENETGDMYVLTGASLLRQFERVPDGAEVIVEYNGRKDLKGGKQPMKDFTVYCKGSLLSIKKNEE